MSKKHKHGNGKSPQRSFDTSIYHQDAGKVSQTTSSTWKRCYEDHPTLKFGQGELTGSSCTNPKILNADIYVGLDYSMKQTNRRFPWEPGEEIHYKLTDMCAPENGDTFIAMAHWLAEQLILGKKVHVGCMGGHGRTGLLMASILAELWNLASDPLTAEGQAAASFMFDLPDQEMLQERDFIGWMREYHCKKAVESYAQINFLKDRYNAKGAAPIKGFEGTKSVVSKAPSSSTNDLIEQLKDDSITAPQYHAPSNTYSYGKKSSYTSSDGWYWDATKHAWYPPPKGKPVENKIDSPIGIKRVQALDTPMNIWAYPGEGEN